MADKEFLINELAKRADTTVRTIRYYTDEGLLPQPSIEGKYAIYNQSHLERLELIRRLKEAFLPLREIRSILLSLTDEEVRQHLQEPPSGAKASPPAGLSDPDERPGARALDYLAQIREERMAKRIMDSPPALFRASRMALENLEIQAFSPQNLPTPPPAGESWRRVVLDEGIELHYSEPVDRQKAGRIQQLIAFGKKLFLTKKKEETDER